MGEVERRTASESRKPDDPLNLRRPVSTIAITINVQGAPPSTLMIDATTLVDLIDGVERYAAKLDYRPLVRFIAREWARARQSNDELMLRGISTAVIWSALNHPDLGEVMRKGVADALRQEGRAHITWQYSPTTGLAMALSDRSVDLGGVVAATPKDTVAAVYNPRNGEPKRFQ